MYMYVYVDLIMFKEFYKYCQLSTILKNVKVLGSIVQVFAEKQQWTKYGQNMDKIMVEHT